jgi:hypothetical protein
MKYTYEVIGTDADCTVYLHSVSIDPLRKRERYVRHGDLFYRGFDCLKTMVQSDEVKTFLVNKGKRWKLVISDSFLRAPDDKMVTTLILHGDDFALNFMLTAPPEVIKLLRRIE